MDFLIDALTNWLKEMLVGGIMSNLSGMFDSGKPAGGGYIRAGRADAPGMESGSVFNMIRDPVGKSIMVPIAGVICWPLS